MKDVGWYNSYLLDIAYSNLRLSSIAVIFNSIVLGIVFYGYVDTVSLLIWETLILLISIIRFLSTIYYEINKKRFSTKKWKILFYTGLISSTFLLGITPFLFFVQESYLHQAMLIIIIAGLSAGAIGSLSSLLRAVQLFLILMIIPLILKLLIQDSTIHNYMASLVFLYLLLLGYIAKKFNRQYMDILESRRMYRIQKEKLNQSEERFKAVFRQAPLGLIIYDANLKIIDANQEFLDFLEAPFEHIIGLDMKKLPDTRIFSALKAPLKNIDGFYEGEYIIAFSKKKIWVSMSTAPLTDSKNNVIGGIGIVADITQRMLIQQQLEYQANYDLLTTIPNRLTLGRRLEQEVFRYQRHKIIFAVMFLDLDNFKNINDSLGHGVGDKLLIQTASRLKKAIRDEDMVARIGGDEFVVLIPDLGFNKSLAIRNSELIANKIHKSLSEVFEIDGHKLNISLSIGITLINSINDDSDAILKHADIAMYEAKKAGRNTTRFYQDMMDEKLKRRIDLENALRDAIEKNELELYYQPIVKYSSSKIIGAEALLRWHCKEFGNVYPDEFIPIAEDSGLILDIGKWVLQSAVKQFVIWEKEFHHLDLLKKIAVNVSTHQFNSKSFLNEVENVLKSNKINARNLELELVESIIVDDVEIVRKKMQSLRDLGISISIDDFGTGYSSLSYLKKLPFTTLKIDKAFVDDIPDDKDDIELVNTILAISNNFKLEVVSEGVENYEQYSYLKGMSCDYMQGYYCSKPLSAKDFHDLLKSDNGICTILKKR